MKSRKTTEAPHLTDRQKSERLKRAKRLLRRFGAGRHRLILFTDEKWFDLEQAHNSQNDRIWSKDPVPPEIRNVGRSQKPKQVMVWAGVTYSGKTPLFFVPNGVTVDGDVYRDLLENHVLDWAEEHFGDTQWCYQQDGAPSHRAIETQEWIRENFPDFIKVDTHWRRNDGDWGSCSPDWNVMDFFVWPYLESIACDKRHNSIDALKESLAKAWDEIPLEMIQNAIDDFPKRLRKTVNAHGGQFD